MSKKYNADDFLDMSPSEIVKAIREEEGSAIPTLLQKAISAELQAVIQYMWQHVIITGLTAESIGSALKNIAKEEMGHVERVAERLNYLTGGIPTTVVSPITLRTRTEDMLLDNVRAELTAIEIYSQLIATAMEEGDQVTLLMAQEILSDENDHHNTYITLLGQK